MGRLSNLSGKEIAKVLERMGFEKRRQKGSHLVMRRGSDVCVVPMHREVKPGTLGGLLKQAGVNISDFLIELNR